MTIAVNNLAAPGCALPVLTFTVADQSCCFPVEQVVRIIEMVTITPLPSAPEGIEGIINLHGQPVPVLDLRWRFGLPRQAYNLSTSIILVEINDTGQLIGIIVDAVEDVLHLVQEEEYVRNAFEPDDRIAEANQQITWLKGIVTTEGRMVLILEVGALLSYQEQYQLRQILAHNIQFMF